MIRLARVVTAAVLMAIIAAPVEAQMAYHSLLNMAGKCDTAVVGTISEIINDAASVKVSETIFGRAVTGAITVSPISIASVPAGS